MTSFRRSSPDERRTPDIQVHLPTGLENEYRPIRHARTRLRWKPWPDLIIPVLVLAALGTWLVWIVVSVFV
jgi:hypothetical protein